jgi:hypothetical protein
MHKAPAGIAAQRMKPSAKIASSHATGRRADNGGSFPEYDLCRLPCSAGGTTALGSVPCNYRGFLNGYIPEPCADDKSPCTGFFSFSRHVLSHGFMSQHRVTRAVIVASVKLARGLE